MNTNRMAKWYIWSSSNPSGDMSGSKILQKTLPSSDRESWGAAISENILKSRDHEIKCSSVLKQNFLSFCVRVFNLRSCHLRLTLGRAPLCIHIIGS
jgi:hypothetical protein